MKRFPYSPSMAGSAVGQFLKSLVAGLTWILLPSLAPGADTPPANRVFRAGAATSNITPPLGTSINGSFQDRRATHIHDELHVRCLALDNGEKQLVLVAVDSCLIERSTFDDAKRRVQQAIGLPMEAMMMSATHAHSGGTLMPLGQSEPDPAYQEFVAQRIADGVRRALNQLEPARIGWGRGKVPQHVFNRRWHVKEEAIRPNPFGGTEDKVVMNPGVGNPHLVEPAGPTDPEVSFISVQSVQGRPIALYANYGVHYVGGVGAGHISADYFGAFADSIQRLLSADRLEPAFVGLMTNGASGDVNNIDFRGNPARLPPYAKIRIVADDVAQEVLRVSKQIRYHDWIPLGVAQRDLTLQVRVPAATEVEPARMLMAQSKALPRLETRDQVYARETVILNEWPRQVSIPLQVMQLGELRIAAIPAEVFAEIGLELKQRHANSFVVSLANGYHGYLPTPAQHRLGGYETWRARWSYLEVEASTKIIRELGELFALLVGSNQ